MPTYAYACTACDHRFEQQQSFDDDALIDCPECSGRLRKLFNSVGIVFKGSGFYRTDSRGKDTSQTAGAGSADTKASSDAKASSSTDPSSTSGASTSSSSTSGTSSTTSSSSSSGTATKSSSSSAA